MNQHRPSNLAASECAPEGNHEPQVSYQLASRGSLRTYDHPTLDYCVAGEHRSGGIVIQRVR